MATDDFSKRIFRIAPAQIVRLRFLAEGYDGLLFVRTLDPRLALVEIAFSVSQQTEAEALLGALADECGLSASIPP